MEHQREGKTLTNVEQRANTQCFCPFVSADVSVKGGAGGPQRAPNQGPLTEAEGNNIWFRLPQIPQR